MSRLVLFAILALLLLGFCAYSVMTTWVFPRDKVLAATCDEWLEQPSARWISLKGCVLDVDLVIVENAEGDFEKLSNRQKGLSLKPYPDAPTWIAAWLPVRTQWLAAGHVRAAYRLESKDLLKWINTLERADEREKERLWADRVALRRLSRPGVLPGRAEKPTFEGLQKAFGTGAAPSLLVVYPGQPPPPQVPVPGLFAGLLGLGVLGYLARRRGVDEATAAQQITQANVADVKLEIGALEEFREEERRAKRKPGPK